MAPNGAISTGKVYLQRPGKLRFDYDPPSQILIVATNWRLIYWDGSIGQENVIPIAKTPLGFLLDEHISLSGAVTVTNIIPARGDRHRGRPHGRRRPGPRRPRLRQEADGAAPLDGDRRAGPDDPEFS